MAATALRPLSCGSRPRRALSSCSPRCRRSVPAGRRRRAMRRSATDCCCCRRVTALLPARIWGLGALDDTDQLSPWDAAPLAERLPAGTYRLATALDAGAATQFALGWLLGGYRFAHDRNAACAADQRPDRPRGRGRALRRGGRAGHESGARSDQHAGQSTRARRSSKPRRCALAAHHGGEAVVVSGEALERDYPLIAAVGAASARAPRLIDCRWPRARRAARDPGGQGCVLRQRRAGPEALRGDAADEEGHGWGGLRAGTGAAAAAAGGADPAAGADPGGREQRRRQRLSAGRRVALAQGADGGDRQHRCRGPAGAGRRADGRRRRAAGSADRSGDPDRRGAHRAGAGSARAVQLR